MKFSEFGIPAPAHFSCVTTQSKLTVVAGVSSTLSPVPEHPPSKVCARFK